MKKLILALLVMLATYPVYVGIRAVITEVQTYRTLKADHAVIIRYFGEPIASQKDADGKDTPINRPMVLDMIIQQALKAAEQQAQSASTPPSK